MRHGGDEREEAEEAGDEREQRGIWRRKTVTPRGKNKGEEEMDDDKKGVGDRWKWQKKKKTNSEKGHLRGNSFPKSLAKP